MALPLYTHYYLETNLRQNLSFLQLLAAVVSIADEVNFFYPTHQKGMERLSMRDKLQGFSLVSAHDLNGIPNENIVKIAHL